MSVGKGKATQGKIFPELHSPLTWKSLAGSVLSWKDVRAKQITWEQLRNNRY